MSRDYHNEFDPFAAQWLRNLIAEGLLPPGDVDERSIVDVRPSDLAGYTRCHFFSGIGGWPLALRLAGWPDDRPVWTGSCPCQPFSAAGRGAGFADERHLWPSWFHLIRVWRPPVLFGEQVASGPAGAWCDLVQDDLEGMDYAFGAVPLPAASIGAPHIRDRLWWVADAGREGRGALQRAAAKDGRAPFEPDGHGDAGIVGLAAGVGRPRLGPEPEHVQPVQTGQSPWSDAEWIWCRDGKHRPTKSGLLPLAHGISGRVGRLRAYGNAIVPPLAAEFIRVYLECRSDHP